MVAAADTTRLALVAETAFGVTPTNPAFFVLPFVSESLNPEVSTSLSAMMNPLRQPIDSSLTNIAVQGDITVELFQTAVIETLMSAALGSDWAANVLKVGNQIKSYTIERRFDLGGGTYTYQRFRGCSVNTMNMSVRPGEPVSITFGFVGASMAVAETALSGSTYTDASSNPVFVAPDVTNISVEGLLASTPCFTEIGIQYTNNLRALPCIGQLGAKEMALGRSETTLNASLYFADNSLYTRLLDQTPGAVSFKLNDKSTPVKSYTIALPKAKLASVSSNASGTNQDVVAQASFMALLQGAPTNSNLTITRA